jgi:hypothetical protein
MQSNDYTRENVQEAAQIVLEKAGVERRVSNAMMEDAHMNLPDMCKFAAEQHFIWGDTPSGKTLTALLLVRKALRQLGREGQFKFQPESAEE